MSIIRNFIIASWNGRIVGDEKIPDDIAITLMQICENLSRSGKFVGYSWREEMVNDAIVSCIKFARNFNPEKSENPFAFYTQIAYNSFLKRIGQENQRLAMLAEYKDQMTTLYDVQPDCDDDGDNRYGSIESTAKRINRTYLKPKKNKKRKESEVKTIDDWCEAI